MMARRQTTRSLLLCLGLLLLAACPPQEETGAERCAMAGAGELSTSPSTRLVFPEVVVGSRLARQVELWNVGEQELGVCSIRVEEADPIRELQVDPSPSGQEACWRTKDVRLSPGGGCTIAVVYLPLDAAPDVGHLIVVSTDPVFPTWRVALGSPGAAPRISVVPPENIIFEGVLQGTRATESLTIRNTGTADLEVEAVELVNNAAGDFDLRFSEASPRDQVPGTLEPQDEDDYLVVDVTYQPSRAGQDTGKIRVRSNDEDRPVVIVDLVARSIFPCVQVTPLDLDFWQVLVGDSEEATVEVTNCGNADLVVDSLRLSEETSTDLSISVGLDGLDDACLRDRDAACTGEAIIGGNATKAFLVLYAPSGEGEDVGRVVLHTSVQGNEVVEVNLLGRGTPNVRPVCLAEARVAGAQEWGPYEDEDHQLETKPLETIELRAAGSQDPDGSIVAYKWQVVQRPNDSTARIVPHEGAREATFFLDLAGQYVFELEVMDNYGQPSRPNCLVVVEAIPVADIHVQLVWDTPADPDQTDTGFGVGSDMDLHLRHPEGTWFCKPRDVSYTNPNPDWGTPFDPSDDPHLDIDDSDGAGPETITLNHPEDARLYWVGVHYHNDHGYGPSFATVRVFIRGVPRFELADRRMARTDAFWEVATIAWPGGQVTPIDRLHGSPPEADCE